MKAFAARSATWFGGNSRRKDFSAGAATSISAVEVGSPETRSARPGDEASGTHGTPQSLSHATPPLEELPPGHSSIRILPIMVPDESGEPSAQSEHEVACIIENFALRHGSLFWPQMMRSVDMHRGAGEGAESLADCDILHVCGVPWPPAPTSAAKDTADSLATPGHSRRNGRAYDESSDGEDGRRGRFRRSFDVEDGAVTGGGKESVSDGSSVRSSYDSDDDGASGAASLVPAAYYSESVLTLVSRLAARSPDAAPAIVVLNQGMSAHFAAVLVGAVPSLHVVAWAGPVESTGCLEFTAAFYGALPDILAAELVEFGRTSVSTAMIYSAYHSAINRMRSRGFVALDPTAYVRRRLRGDAVTQDAASSSVCSAVDATGHVQHPYGVPVFLTSLACAHGRFPAFSASRLLRRHLITAEDAAIEMAAEAAARPNGEADLDILSDSLRLIRAPTPAQRAAAQGAVGTTTDTARYRSRAAGRTGGALFAMSHGSRSRRQQLQRLTIERTTAAAAAVVALSAGTYSPAGIADPDRSGAHEAKGSYSETSGRNAADPVAYEKDDMCNSDGSSITEHNLLDAACGVLDNGGARDSFHEPVAADESENGALCARASDDSVTGDGSGERQSDEHLLLHGLEASLVASSLHARSPTASTQAEPTVATSLQLNSLASTSNSPEPGIVPVTMARLNERMGDYNAAVDVSLDRSLYQSEAGALRETTRLLRFVESGSWGTSGGMRGTALRRVS